MITIHASWVDKRHIVLRSPEFKNGASNHHFINEDEAARQMLNYLNNATDNGYNIQKVADRDWILTKS